jgi:hypothetical protein
MRTWLLAWVVITCLWIGGTAYVAYESRPRISLDMSRGDPQVTAAFERAVARHNTRFLAIGAAPPILLLIALWAVSRSRRPAS